ncbi:MAG: prepilin-type N-terminal cleavage/methylation domain-containing protein [Burkholderiales bacterium]|nr:prepilin-type N-terminal cleavage/methylation domain-containing protein [Burkholderiales bacterium]
MKFLRRRWLHPLQRAFTLIEMMVVIALVGIILMLAAPSFNEMIGMQRLRAINDQLATDFQFMRTEAVSRNQFMALLTRNQSAESMSCYTILSSTDPAFFSGDPVAAANTVRAQCNCTNAVGAACSGSLRELRTVQIPRSLSIELRFPADQSDLIVDSPVNGGMRIMPSTTLTTQGYEFCVEVRRTPRGRLRTGVGLSGRTSVCSPDGSVPGVPVCPAYDATVRNCKATS